MNSDYNLAQYLFLGGGGKIPLPIFLWSKERLHKSFAELELWPIVMSSMDLSKSKSIGQ